ncbi:MULTISPECIES: threonine/serine exporter family protein [unclassified Treponema]|uniref:threonine/serine exporter family protein n=1 Tax=unclassified Treponema TaxID=2638727 RepID=UPI0020A23A89|nr:MULTISPECIES: threonine/serine exporter family protein [unclassified Treponema]UTC67186.1 threonine/serine exporter family protein [Treponema sp. OMZ 789]UTC69916.1 threonine/serine exporter family protein [Treponema sp. OMZ 790]UTC72631.1 threonine/serine exporter family protein [Treponema sp. OMZ 791]
MPLYVHSIASFIASFCFCFLFSVPKKNTYLSALCGSISWTILIFFQNMGVNYIFATLAGAIAVGILADFFAVLQKTPVTCFIVIGTIPLVPGFKVYKTMLFFVTDRLEKGVSEGVQAAFIAIAISVGLIISTSAIRLIRTIKKRTANKIKK